MRERTLSRRAIRRYAALAAVAFANLILTSACGRVLSPGDVASAANTISPQATTSASPSSGPVVAANDCTGPSGGAPTTKTKALGLDSITMSIPAGWMDDTSKLTGGQGLLYLRAPSSYGTDDASVTLLSIPGPRRQSSSHQEAVHDAANLGASATSSVSDCQIGGQAASFYEFYDSRGNDSFRIAILHSPSSKWPFLYIFAISSHGVIDSQARVDVRSILGSWAWGPPLYDPSS